MSRGANTDEYGCRACPAIHGWMACWMAGGCSSGRSAIAAGGVVSPTSRAIEKLLEHLTGDESGSVGGGVGGSCTLAATDGHSSSVMLSDE